MDVGGNSGMPHNPKSATNAERILMKRSPLPCFTVLVPESQTTCSVDGEQCAEFRRMSSQDPQQFTRSIYRHLLGRNWGEACPAINPPQSELMAAGNWKAGPPARF